MCVKSFRNLSLKTGCVLLLVRHIITQKPLIDSGLSIAVKDCEFDKWALSQPSTCVGSAWENRGGMLEGRSVLSPKCHVWEHR